MNLANTNNENNIKQNYIETRKQELLLNPEVQEFLAILEVEQQLQEQQRGFQKKLSLKNNFKISPRILPQIASNNNVTINVNSK